MSTDCIHKLAELKTFLLGEVIGQEEPVEMVSDAVLRAELGVTRPNKPKSGMLLLGPTGTGKTQIVLSVGEFLYGDAKNRVKRFDMAEYQRQESLSYLLGDSKSEQGILGDAIDALNAQGGGILLFDEIEKAHKSLITIFLSILDAGRITMSSGETKDLSQFYIFFTSNLGAKNAAQMVYSNYVTVRKCVERSARDFFSPELFARFDEIAVFKRLSFESQLEICKKMLSKELALLEHELKTSLIVDDEVFNFLVQKGYTNDLGARIMLKAIEKELGNALVSWKLRSTPSNGPGSLKIEILDFKLSIN